MRLSCIWFAATLFAIPSVVSGYSSAPPPKAGPANVPYLCNGGQPASVVYESGSDFIHARALVTYDGRTVAMRAAPTLYGVRYRTDTTAEGGQPLAWSLRGEQALLTEAPDADSYTRQERALANCVRLRGAAVAEAGAHGAAHAADHGEDHGDHH